MSFVSQMFLTLVFTGGGKFSLDALLFRKKRKPGQRVRSDLLQQVPMEDTTESRGPGPDATA